MNQPRLETDFMIVALGSNWFQDIFIQIYMILYFY